LDRESSCPSQEARLSYCMDQKMGSRTSPLHTDSIDPLRKSLSQIFESFVSHGRP
jgi:hypothetical protein